MIYKKFLCFLAVVSIANSATAQRYLGVSTGGYNAINSLYLNPANISGANERIAVSVFSINAGVDNNLGTFISLSNLGSSDAFTVNGSGSFNMLAPMLEMRLPGVMVSLGDKLKQGFALTTRIRAINQFNHFDPNLYTTATSNDHTSNQSYTFESNNFNWTAHVWSELCLSYALQIVETGPHKLKAGITLKYLGGIDYLSLKGRNLNVTYTSGSDTFFANHSDIEFASNAVSSNSALNNGIQLGDIFGSLFGSKTGSGFGMDIGVTYTYTVGGNDKFSGEDDNDETGHRITAAFAVTDIGAVRYNDGHNFFVNVTGNGYLTGKGLSDNLDNSTKFKNYMEGQGFTADTGNRATKIYMPTALVASADYQVYKRFYANVTYMANLANRQSYGNSYYNQLSIVPRYDYRLLSIGMPVTISSLAGDVKFGLGFRITGFFIGSDDMLALFSNHQHGFSAYVGGFVPLYRKQNRGFRSIK